jgi:type IV pilus assembly protein PilO
MTVSGDFIPANGEDFGGEPTYPTVFGIELTPKVLGIIAAVAGLGLAIFLYTRFVQPVRQQNQILRAQIAEKQQLLATQQQQLEAIAEVEADLERALQQRRNVYALFANEESMDTLLLDINQRVKNSNAALASLRNQVRARNIPPILIEAQLGQFNPSGDEVIQDSSLGEALNGKLRRQTYSVQFSGDFAQTQSILSNIERLEPLLLLEGFQINAGEVVNETVVNAGGQVIPQPKQKLTTTFNVNALIPTADPNELPEVAPPAPPEGEAPADGAAAPPPEGQ